MAEQIALAKETIDEVIDTMVEDIIAATGADIETARDIADQTMEEIFNEIVFDVAD